MVGLVNCVSLSPIDNNLKKMSDSTAKDELVEEKSEEKPLSNGDGDSNATNNQPENTTTQPTNTEEQKLKMDIKKEEDNGPSQKGDESEVTTPAPESKDKSVLRKKRSSRSHSSNSSSTPAVKTDETVDQDEKSKAICSDEEDFYGFESPDSDGRLNPINYLKLAADSESGLETPSTSIIKRSMRNTKKALNVDLSNPAFKKPFEYGWVRELVYRSVASDQSLNKRNGDVYYFAPSGKKVRSSRELLEHLHDGLTLDNFTFFKEPIGLNDPFKEIIREAKTKPSTRGSIDEPAMPTVKKATPKVKVQLSTAKSSVKEVKTVTPKVVFKGNTPSKAKVPPAVKSKLDKKRKSAGPDDVDMLMDTNEWSPESSPKINANGLKRTLESPTENSSEKKSKIESKDEKSDESDDASGVTSTDNGSYEVTASCNEETTIVGIAPPSFMMQLNAGFNTLLHAFQFLKVNELLRASCVSRVWNMVASHHSLWEVVRMKNSKVSNWEGFGKKLNFHSTKVLDLRKMLVPESPEEQVKMWEDLVKAVEQVKSIVKVDMGRCSPAAFTAMALAMPQLESLVSLAIKGNEIDLSPVTNCLNLTELKLKAVSGGLEIKDLSCLKELKNLKTLGLTTIKNLKGIEDYLPEGLVSLELGECSQISKSFATDALPRLTNLKRLRLEKGQNDCPTMALLDAVSSLPLLTQLELINFDIKPGFDKAIAKCTNLKTLLIIPTYVTQSATTNHVVMGGVAKLSHTLTYFIWGLTLELLKVTDLFIGQVENQKSGKVSVNPPKKGNGDSIPILKPSQETDLKEGGGQAPSQVDILALPNLQRVLSTLLPTTKIKILKVPFSATWRQTVTDGPSNY